MAYVPDATVTSEPINGRPAGTGAAEFRALKQYLSGLLGFPSGLSFVQPNLLVNPNWNIDQINEGGLYTINAGAVQGPDGWTGGAVGTGVFKVRTLADPDNAALKCLEITCTTADAAIAAGDLYFLQTSIEGYDAAALMAGTANAQQITISFKFKSNVNGVYGVSVKNSAANRSYVGTITVVDAAEHDYVVNLTMDTAGVWLYTTGKGLVLEIALAGGTTFQAVAGAWTAGNFYTTSAQCNFMSAITSVAYLKRIQLIRGGNVLPFQPADIQKELDKAQRYYAKTFPQGVAVAQNAGVAGALTFRVQSVAAPVSDWRFRRTMRATPTVVTYNPSVANTSWRNVTAGTDIAVIVDSPTSISGEGVNISGTANGAANEFCAIHATANCRLS